MTLKEFEKLARAIQATPGYEIYSIGKMVRLETVLQTLALEVTDAHKVEVLKDDKGSLSVRIIPHDPTK